MPLHVLWLQWRRLGPVCCGTVGFRLHGSDRTMTLVGRCADTTHPVSQSRCACMHPAAIRTRLTPERSCRARIDPSDKARARSLAPMQAVISHPSTAPQQPRARRAKHRPSAGSQPIRIMTDDGKRAVSWRNCTKREAAEKLICAPWEERIFDMVWKGNSPTC